jgi:hypothetical protein
MVHAKYMFIFLVLTCSVLIVHSQVQQLVQQPKIVSEGVKLSANLFPPRCPPGEIIINGKCQNGTVIL